MMREKKLKIKVIQDPENPENFMWAFTKMDQLTFKNVHKVMGWFNQGSWALNDNMPDWLEIVTDRPKNIFDRYYQWVQDHSTALYFWIGIGLINVYDWEDYQKDVIVIAGWLMIITSGLSLTASALSWWLGRRA